MKHRDSTGFGVDRNGLTFTGYPRSKHSPSVDDKKSALFYLTNIHCLWHKLKPLNSSNNATGPHPIPLPISHCDSLAIKGAFGDTFLVTTHLRGTLGTNMMVQTFEGAYLA